eukprot:scaffold328087_cov52-Tisochrysis_lutea.AAC.1
MMTLSNVTGAYLTYRWIRVQQGRALGRHVVPAKETLQYVLALEKVCDCPPTQVGRLGCWTHHVHDPRAPSAAWDRRGKQATRETAHLVGRSDARMMDGASGYMRPRGRREDFSPGASHTAFKRLECVTGVTYHANASPPPTSIRYS